LARVGYRNQTTRAAFLLPYAEELHQWLKAEKARVNQPYGDLTTVLLTHCRQNR
jgi:hypothetical protein